MKPDVAAPNERARFGVPVRLKPAGEIRGEVFAVSMLDARGVKRGLPALAPRGLAHVLEAARVRVREVVAQDLPPRHLGEEIERELEIVEGILRCGLIDRDWDGNPHEKPG